MESNDEEGCFVKGCNRNSETKRTLFPIPSKDSPMYADFEYALGHSEYCIDNALPKAKFICSKHFNLEGFDNVDELPPTSIPTLYLSENESNDYSFERCVCKEKENYNENILIASENLPTPIFTNVEELYTLNFTELLMHPNNTNSNTHNNDEPSPKRLRSTVDPSTDNFPTQEDTDSIFENMLIIGSSEDVFFEEIVPYSVCNKDDSNEKLNMKYKTQINQQMEKIRNEIETLDEANERLTSERKEILEELEIVKIEAEKEKSVSELSLSLEYTVNKCEVSAETIMFASIILGIRSLGEPELKMCSKLHNSSPTTYTYIRDVLGFNYLPAVEYDEHLEDGDLDV